MRLTALALPLPPALLALAACDAVPGDCTVYLEPGADDQTQLQQALVDATDGTTVCLSAGTFSLTDPLEVTGLDRFTLRGFGMLEGGTVLDFSGQEVGGNGVHALRMTNVRIEALAILEAKGNGLQVNASDGVTINEVRVGWMAGAATENGKYAIYPVSSTNVVVENSEVFGASDAGFYMGQVDNCVMRNNVAYLNVAAYEVENTSNCEVAHNVAMYNTAGILVFELPGLPRFGAGASVHHNMVFTNNEPNFAEAGTIVGVVPTGSGILVMGGNDVEIFANDIQDNKGVGLLVISYLTLELLGGGGGGTDPNYDGYSETVYVHDNTFDNNGYEPGRNPVDDLGAVASISGVEKMEEIVWDGILRSDLNEDTLCLDNNTGATFRNIDIVRDFQNQTTDDSPHRCSHARRPPVSF